MLIKILLIAAALIFLGFTWRRERLGQVTRLNALVWSVLWCGVIVVVSWPDLASRFARWIGVGRGVDAVLYLAVITLFYLVFRLAVRQRQIESQLTDLVRALALKDLPDEDRGE